MPLPRKVQNIWTEKKIREACRLYAVTDSSYLCGRSLPSCVADAIIGGVTFVQLRKKGASTLELIKLARAIAPVCRVANVPFVIDNDIEAAKATGIDGVHVGQSDISCADVRSILGENAIVGVSVTDVEQALQAEVSGASYIGVGSIFDNLENKHFSFVSLDTLRDICKAVKIPVVAIGGITTQTIPELRGAGISGVAVKHALFASDNIEKAAKGILEAVDNMMDEL